MSEVGRALEAKRKRPSSGGRGVIPSLWRGQIVEVYGDGRVSVVVPSLLGDENVQVACLYAGPAIGDRVIVGAIEGRTDDLIVMIPG